MDVLVTSDRADALIRERTRLHMTPRVARCNSGRYARFDTGATRCPTPFRVHKKHQADNETLPSGGAETPVAISLGLSFWPEVVQAMQATQTTVQFAIIESPLPFLTLAASDCLGSSHPRCIQRTSKMAASVADLAELRQEELDAMAWHPIESLQKHCCINVEMLKPASSNRYKQDRL